MAVKIFRSVNPNRGRAERNEVRREVFAFPSPRINEPGHVGNYKFPGRLLTGVLPCDGEDAIPPNRLFARVNALFDAASPDMLAVLAARCAKVIRMFNVVTRGGAR